jgi:hypothetical protein
MSIVNGSSTVAQALPPVPLPVQSSDGATMQSSDLVPVSFTPPFFLRDMPNDTPVSATSPGKQVGATRHYYCKAVYGSYSNFRESVGYARYRNEFAQDVEFLKNFYAERSMPDAGRIGERLIHFYRQRFSLDLFLGEHDPDPFFGDLEYLIDSQGKQSLDRICDMVRDEDIPVEKKTAAIHDLALGLDVCGQGVVLNLVAAEGELAMSSTGIWAELWKAKQMIAEAVIKQTIQEKFSPNQNFREREIHWVGSIWNGIADTIGLIPRSDVYETRFADKSLFLETCRDTVRRALTPDRLAGVIGEECLGMFSQQLATRKRELLGDYSLSVQEDCEVILQDIQMHYRLAPTFLDLSAFLWIDDTGKRYRVRKDATLVARAFLGIMRSEGLLTEASVAVSHAEWLDSDGMRHSLLTFGGSLVWRADRIDTLSGTSEWSLDTDAEQFTMRDLFAWWKACGGTAFPTVFPATMLTAALKQAVDGVDPADIDDIPLGWLLDIENLFIVLPHMTDRTVDLCLQANVPYFKEHLSTKDRADLIDRAMGRSRAMLELAEYPNAWALLSEPRGKRAGSRLQYWMSTDNGRAIGAMLDSVRGKLYLNVGMPADGATIYEALFGLRSKPALNLAMAAGNVNSTAAWFSLVLAPGVIDTLGKRLFGLLESKNADGGTALGQALAKGRPQSMEQFYDVFAQPAVVARLGKGMCRLMRAYAKADVPGLLVAMEDGYTECVQVIHAMLVAPTVLPHVESELLVLVRARGRRTGVHGFRATGTTGLLQAMKYGRAGVIRAFHVMVVDPRILPRIAKGFRILVTDKGQDGNGCLAMALEYGHAGAIRAFREMAADPLVTPNIEGVLDEVVLALTGEGQIGLGRALEKGHANAIVELHAFVVAPAIRPFITRSIPKLFFASRRDGTLSLSLAVRDNHAPAVTAIADMLADPKVLPLVRHDLSRLISRVLDDLEKLSDVWDTSKSLEAMRESPSAAWTAFRLMVERPEIAACLDEKTLKRLRGPQEEEPAAVPKAARTTTGEVPQRGAGSAYSQPRASMMRRVVQRLTRNS